MKNSESDSARSIFWNDIQDSGWRQVSAVGVILSRSTAAGMTFIYPFMLLPLGFKSLRYNRNNLVKLSTQYIIQVTSKLTEQIYSIWFCNWLSQIRCEEMGSIYTWCDINDVTSMMWHRCGTIKGWKWEPVSDWRCFSDHSYYWPYY